MRGRAWYAFGLGGGRASLRRLAACGGVVASSTCAWAFDSWVVVERQSGAETCPDTRALDALVASVRARPIEGPSQYRVEFARRESTFHAHIVRELDASRRVLSDPSESCDALARATAVTLALLLDAEAEARPVAPEPRAPRRAPSKPQQAIPLRSSGNGARRELALSLHVGALALAGVLRPIAPAIHGGVGLRSSWMSADVSAVWAWPVRRELGPGEVETSMLGADVALGVAVFRRAPYRLDLSTGVIGGFLSARARGFTRSDQQVRPWLAVPFGASLVAVRSNVAVRVGASLLVPIRREHFRVDGVGTVYESSPIAGLLWIRVLGVVPL